MLRNKSKLFTTHQNYNTQRFITTRSNITTNIINQKSTIHNFMDTFEEGLVSIGEGMAKQYNEDLTPKKKL